MVGVVAEPRQAFGAARKSSSAASAQSESSLPEDREGVDFVTHYVSQVDSFDPFE